MAAACPVVSDSGRKPQVPVDEPRRKDVRSDAEADNAREIRRAFVAGPRQMTDRHSFGRILASLWEAALDDTLWPAAAVAIEEACAIKGNNLVVARKDGGDGVQLLCQAGYRRGEPRPDFDRDYMENYYAADERVPRMTLLPGLSWAPIAALYSRVAVRKQETSRTLPLKSIHPENAMSDRYAKIALIALAAALCGPVASTAHETEMEAPETTKLTLKHLRVDVQKLEELTETLGKFSSDPPSLDAATKLQDVRVPLGDGVVLRPGWNDGPVVTLEIDFE